MKSFFNKERRKSGNRKVIFHSCLPAFLILILGFGLWTCSGQTILTAYGLASFVPKVSVSGLQVDTFQDFHTGNAGDLITPTILQASARGDNNWITNDPIATWKVTNAPNFTLRTPISVGGTTITTSGGKAVYFDMTGEDSRPAEEFGFAAPSGIKTMRWGFFAYYDGLSTNNAFATHDYARWNGSSFFVPFHVQSTVGPDTTQFYSHFQYADDSSAIIPLTGLRGAWMWFEATPCADGSRFLEIYDPNNSYALVGSVYGYSGKVNADFTDPGFLANYIPNLGMSGIVAIGPSFVIENPNTNTSPWFPNPPTSIIATQSFDHEVTIRWLESNSGLSPIQVSNTVSGTTTLAGGLITGPTWTNMVVTNLSNGTAYSFDVAALYVPSSRRSSVVTVGPLTLSEIDVTNGLIGEWRMNGNYNDSTVNANNGTAVNEPGFDVGVGNVLGYSSLFNSVASQYIDLATPASLQIQAPLTMSAWVKVPETGTDFNSLFGSGGNGVTVNGNPNILFYAGSHIYLQAQFVTAIAESTSNMPTNTWTHIAITYDASANWKIYINGALDASGNTGSVVTFTYPWNLQIGRGANDGGGTHQYFTGDIEDFRIYNRDLTSGEVATISHIPPQ